ncbi:MAG: transcriptional regulator [Candidatus Lokiarchaeota archaeon]|nr:transcriptional regulator [Candidatus Lokiarchaeota archaeon]
MKNYSENLIKKIVENSKRIKPKAFNLTRCTLLALMAYNKDGLQYRELKKILDISDGKLKSNLDYLQDVEYIRKIPIRLDKKEMHIYMIEDSGISELKKIIQWTEFLRNVEELKND